MSDDEYEYSKLSTEKKQRIKFMRETYKAIVNYAKKTQYICPAQNDLEFAKTDEEFSNALIKRKNESTKGYNNLFSYMTNLWMKKRVRGDTSPHTVEHRGLLMYCSDSKGTRKSKITKAETRAAWDMLLTTKAKRLVFIYDGDVISSAERSLINPMELPSTKTYNVRMYSAKNLIISEVNNIWVPKHSIVPNPKLFLEKNNLTKGHLPEICIDDRGLSRLEVRCGDIIEIEQDFPYRNYYYRIVVNSKNNIK